MTTNPQTDARMIRAPWSSGQVQALNDFQERGGMHPFTCGGALHASGRSPELTATHAGWICPDSACEYTQDWAWRFMAAVSVPAPAPTDQTAAVEERTARYLFDQDWTRTLDVDAARKLLAAVLPATQTADWDALVRETGRLRLEAIELHDQAAEIDARVAEFELRGTAEIRAAALREAADFLRDAHFRDGLSVQEIGTAIRHWADRELAAAASGSGRVADETQAHAPHHRWYVETYDYLADEWAPGQRFTDRPEAIERYTTVSETRPTWDDGTPVRRRFVRETVSFTVEQPAVVSQPDGEA